MGNSAGESEKVGLRLDFDRRLWLEFHGASGLTALAADTLIDPRTGMNGRHSLMAQLRQSVFGRLAGYEDMNDADRLGRDPAMRWVVGGRAVMNQAASTSQMGRFETGAMTSTTN